MLQTGSYDDLANRYSQQNPQIPFANQQSVAMMMPIHAPETWIEGNVQTYIPNTGLQTSTIVPQNVPIQQPRVHQITVQKNVQVPKTVMVQESKEITTSKPKYEYESKTLMIPQTITRSRVVYETKMIPIQVEKVVTVPKTIEVEREIRIPVPVKQKRTVTVPRTKTVMESVEVAYEVPATEEVRQIVQVPRSITTMETVQVPETAYVHEQPTYVEQKYTQHVVAVQPAAAKTVTEASALAGPAATLFYHPTSVKTVAANYSTPPAFVSTGAGAPLNVAHTYVPSVGIPVASNYTPDVYTGAQTTGYAGTYAAAPVVSGYVGGYPNGLVAAGGYTGQAQYGGTTVHTLYGTDPGQ